MNTKENNFIPSIFNYCDRWCERCDYTGRCRLFSMEEERKGENDGEEKYNFIKEFHKTFEETRKLIEEYAAKFDKDFSNVEEIREKEPPVTPLSFLATKYFEDASGYLKNLMAEIKSSGIENAAISACIPQNPGMKKLLEIVECYEIVQWYHTMIPVKINRAVSATTKDNSDDEESEFSLYDANGSAYVAYKSVLKSITALGVILSWTGLLKEETLNLIIDAGRIKTMVETDFSGAPGFIWPPEESEN